MFCWLTALEELYCLLGLHLLLRRTPSAGCFKCVEACHLCTYTQFCMPKLMTYPPLNGVHWTLFYQSTIQTIRAAKKHLRLLLSITFMCTPHCLPQYEICETHSLNQSYSKCIECPTSRWRHTAEITLSWKKRPAHSTY